MLYEVSWKPRLGDKEFYKTVGPGQLRLHTQGLRLRGLGWKGLGFASSRVQYGYVSAFSSHSSNSIHSVYREMPGTCCSSHTTLNHHIAFTKTLLLEKKRNPPAGCVTLYKYVSRLCHYQAKAKTCRQTPQQTQSEGTTNETLVTANHLPSSCTVRY